MNRITCVKPTPFEVAMYQATHNIYSGIMPEPMPVYTRFMQRTIPADIQADADLLYPDNGRGTVTRECFKKGYIDGRIAERDRLEQYLKDSWNAAANYYNGIGGIGSYPCFADWSEQYIQDNEIPKQSD